MTECGFLFLFGPTRLLWVNQSVRFDIVKYFLQKLSGQIFCHWKVHIQVITAIFRSGAGDFSLKITDEFKGLGHQWNNIPLVPSKAFLTRIPGDS